MSQFHTLPIKVDRYLAQTRTLSAAQHGAYFLLLLTAWKSDDNSLPDDDNFLARSASMGPRMWARNKSAILRFWSLSAGRWRQRTLDEVRHYVANVVSQKSSAGRASALKRKETHPTAVEIPSNSQSQSQTIPKGIDIPPYPPLKGNGHDKRTRVRKTISFIGDDFQPDVKSIALACNLGIDAEKACREFINYWQGRGEGRADWQATFRTRLDKLAEYRAERQQRDAARRPKATDVVGAAFHVIQTNRAREGQA